MPNVVYVGGLEACMQSSGEPGVVVMSLGTLVSALPKEVVTEEVAQAFAQLPHMVVWSFLEEIPSVLWNNTQLLDWLPQNNVLGHPNTCFFVAHGGTSGLYEVIYHWIPVLGLPLLFDQFDNALRLQVRGATQMRSGRPYKLTEQDRRVLKCVDIACPRLQHTLPNSKLPL
jgi:glucuronosyltransferase